MKKMIIIANCIALAGTLLYLLSLYARELNPTAASPAAWQETALWLTISITILSILLSHLRINSTAALVIAFLPIVWILISVGFIAPQRAKQHMPDLTTLTRTYVCPIPAAKAATKKEIFYTIDPTTKLLIYIENDNELGGIPTVLGKVDGATLYTDGSELKGEYAYNAENCYDANSKTIFDTYTIVALPADKTQELYDAAASFKFNFYNKK